MKSTNPPGDTSEVAPIGPDPAVSKLRRRPSADAHRLPATPVANPHRVRLIDLCAPRNLEDAIRV